MGAGYHFPILVEAQAYRAELRPTDYAVTDFALSLGSRTKPGGPPGEIQKRRNRLTYDVARMWDWCPCGLFDPPTNKLVLSANS